MAGRIGIGLGKSQIRTRKTGECGTRGTRGTPLLSTPPAGAPSALCAPLALGS
jgi:hypothetical protein